MSRRNYLDDDELRNLEIDLEGAPYRIQRNGPTTLRKAARLVDAGMRVDAAGHQGNWFGRPGTSYETPLPEHVSHELITPWEAEIGIESKGAGKLAHIIVYGSVNNPPVYDHTAALRRARPEIEKMFADTTEESVLGGEK